MLILAAAFGLAIGVALGLLGGGGSILAVPVLVYALGQSVTQAVPTSLLVVGASSVGGAVSYLRAGNVPWRTALVFGACGVGGSVAGADLNQRLDEDALLLGFAAVMVVAAIAMLRRSSQESISDDDSDAVRDDAWRKHSARVVGLGAAVGFMTGLFGVGGGFLVVPALTFAFDYPMQVAVGASLLVIVINSAGGFASHLGYGSIDFGVATAFTVAGIVGAVAAGRFSQRFNPAGLTRWFGYLVLAVAAYVVVEVLVLDGGAVS